MKWKHYLGLGLAALACPCHLPILLAMLSGTALGAWIGQYTAIVIAGMAGIFVLALLYSVRALNRQYALSKAPERPDTDPAELAKRI